MSVEGHHKDSKSICVWMFSEFIHSVNNFLIFISGKERDQTYGGILGKEYEKTTKYIPQLTTAGEKQMN